MSTEYNYMQERRLSPAQTQISWGAIFGGTVVAIVTAMVLNLLGVAVGLSTIDPLAERNPLEGIGMGAAIWWSLSMLAALYAGGWVSGHLSGQPRKTDGALHGLLSWSLVALFGVFAITTTAGALFGGAASLIGKGAGAAREGVEAIAPGAMNQAQQEFQQQAQALIPMIQTKTQGNSRQQAQNQGTEQAQMQTQGQDPARDQQREQVRREAEQTARQAGDKTAEAGSKAAFLTFIALVLGAAASALGGMAGIKKDFLSSIRTAEQRKLDPSLR